MIIAALHLIVVHEITRQPLHSNSSFKVTLSTRATRKKTYTRVIDTAPPPPPPVHLTYTYDIGTLHYILYNILTLT